MPRRYWKFALLLVFPLALYAFVAERNSWQPKVIVVAEGRPLSYLEFAPDGDYILTRVQGPSGQYYFCDVASRRATLLPIEQNSPIHLLDKNRLIGRLKTQNKQAVNSHQDIEIISAPEGFFPIGALPDGRTIIGQVYGDDWLWTWNVDEKRMPQGLLRLKKPKGKSEDFFPKCILLKDGETLLVDNLGTLLNYEYPDEAQFPVFQFQGYDIWNIKTKTVRRLPIRKGIVRQLIGSTKSGLLFLRDYDYRGRIDVWNYKTCKKLRTINLKNYNGGPHELVFGPESNLIAGFGATASGSSIGVWDINTRELIRVIKTKNYGKLAFSADGRRLAFASDNFDSTIQVWRIK